MEEQGWSDAEENIPFMILPYPLNYTLNLNDLWPIGGKQSSHLGLFCPLIGWLAFTTHAVNNIFLCFNIVLNWHDFSEITENQ